MNSIWHHVSVDIETYSDVDIKKAGLYKYAQSPEFDILLIAWAVDDRPVRIIDLAKGEDPEPFLEEVYYSDDVILHAYNAAFEHYCLNTWARRQGWETRPIGDWRCTMAHGLYCGYTAGLAATGEAMGLPTDKRKLGIGGTLIRKFCVPQKPDRAHPLPWRARPEDEPEKWELFKTYCMQDVETEREIKRRLNRWPMPAREQILWELTTEANIEGVGVDIGLVNSAIRLGEDEQAALVAEAKRISGMDNPKSVRQLMTWLNEELETDGDTEITDLKKATVAEMLERLKGDAAAAGTSSDPAKAGPPSAQGHGYAHPEGKAQRMLELRQLMSKTSTKKYDALQAAVCDDGRVRGMMFYYGANRTGRWAGRIVQPQNLPQNHLPSLDLARRLVKDGDAEMVKLCYGSVPDTLSQLIRTAFVPRRGKRYAVADYSAIEARVVAWLAGEDWVLGAFEAGEDIYCATASQMFGVPVEKHGMNSELRQRGKVATLALGYGGGESALVAMGALKMGIPEEDLPEIKAKWRQANPEICRLWKKVEAAALATVSTGAETRVRCVTLRREADPATNQDFLTIELPTRRKLFYAHPCLAPAKNFPDRQSLHYWSVNQTSKKWAATDTWGGKLVENITQAVARDCLAETLLRLRRKGLTAVFHVHDEVIVEVDREDQLNDILDIMAEPLEWAPGLPLKGAGFCCEYYQKD